MALFGQSGHKPLKMCYYGDPVLKKKSSPVVNVDENLREFAKRMIVTMHKHNGIGLAAPQVGKNIRMYVIDIPPPEADDAPLTTPGEIALQHQMPLVLINPELSNFSESTSTMCEGCLSIPEVNGDVERPETLDISFEDLSGKRQSYHCGGLLARCMQHEQDHLDGILFTELIPEEQLEEAQPVLRKLKKKGRP